MKKPFDKKSTSGLAKKPEKPQLPVPATGTGPDVRQDRAPKPKHKGKKAAPCALPMVAPRPLSIAEGKAGSAFGHGGAEVRYRSERS